MANLSTVTIPQVDDVVINAMLQGSAWVVPDGQTLTYALANGPLGEVWNDPTAEAASLQSLLEQLDFYTAVSTNYAGFFTDPAAAAAAGADITLSLTNAPGIFPTADIWGLAYFPGDPDTFYAGQNGDIYINIDSAANTLPSYAPGSQGYWLLLHELGHAVGLKHPHDDGGTFRPTFDEAELTFANNDVWTVMSYEDSFDFNQISWDPASFMILDVLALQALYGQSAAAPGDDIYVYQGDENYGTLWDSGGTNTLDLSAAPRGMEIVMPEEVFSTLVPSPVGLVVPLGESILDTAPTSMSWLLGDYHHAIGSDFADAIYGNHLSNVLLGGKGDDIMDGGGDLDVATYFGNQNSFTLTLSPTLTTLTDRRADGQGTDQLSNIEFIDFDTNLLDGFFDLTKFAGPAGLQAAELNSFIELYIAYFNRAPDAIGLNFWGTAFANGLTLQEMASLFIDQPETVATYPATQTNAAFATAVYDNVLGRVPDVLGFNFWVNQLDSGGVTRDQFILSVLDGAKAAPPPGATQEFIDQQVADQAFLANKTNIGAYFAVHKGMSDTDNAAAAMGMFDGTAPSLASAVSAIDGFYAEALHAETGSFLMPLIGVLDDPFAIA